jgi:hypothetical protein
MHTSFSYTYIVYKPIKLKKTEKSNMLFWFYSIYVQNLKFKSLETKEQYKR